MNISKKIETFEWIAPVSANATETVRWRWPAGCPSPCISATSVLKMIIQDKLLQFLTETPNGTRDKISKTARERGTFVHELFEKVSLKQWAEIPAEFSEIVRKFREYIDESGALFLDTEVEVFHRKYLYSGRVDALVQVDGKTEIWDYKTYKNKSGITTKTGWQMGAYVLALRSMGIQVDGMKAIGVNLKLNKIETYTYEHLDFCIKMFLKSLDIFRGLYFNNLLRGINIPTEHDCFENKYKFPLEILTMDCAADYAQEIGRGL